jgi:hypothetical protein
VAKEERSVFRNACFLPAIPDPTLKPSEVDSATQLLISLKNGLSVCSVKLRCGRRVSNEGFWKGVKRQVVMFCVLSHWDHPLVRVHSITIVLRLCVCVRALKLQGGQPKPINAIDLVFSRLSCPSLFLQ